MLPLEEENCRGRRQFGCEASNESSVGMSMKEGAKVILSVIIPAYNEQENVEHTAQVIARILKDNDIDYEILFIDDGSIDGTYPAIERAKQQDDLVKGVRFSRNFGKESCIFAGLEQAKGDCAVVIDSDLQQPPELIPRMYQLWQQGYQVVEGIKSERGHESMLHRAFAKLFYRVISGGSQMNLVASSDYKLLDRKVIDVLNQLPERATFFRALSFWVGFQSTSIPYEVEKRQRGKTKWSRRQLFSYAVSNIVSFSSFPLHLVTVLGTVLLAASFVLGIQTLYNFFSGHAVAGFTTVILLLLIIGGAIMLSLGVIGYYISKIFDEVKARPRYIIREKTDDHF